MMFKKKRLWRDPEGLRQVKELLEGCYFIRFNMSVGLIITLRKGGLKASS